ncbi:hypothetical protein THASP1DRAFT_34242 [Thamnocephalis sphaerospora]|uniref:Guanosine-3',5'-bis(diphosphate) 3'-pyrophosphohydrolase MESH1 n=1 Tax=Thamnocephalis sphaerospora TaxID=78915 RepID=A0A4P9XX53_9FUNG|nr:hypothetical protein THASP1DRAFT_34242 [Thamnocephalis sphaerospora]|eukprot:RKP10020.1 hypothetical protein THASP1DRAFT_34242 [Thamnocephalis sphaerospora]
MSSEITSVPLALLRAADFAARKHRDQRRKDPVQTPYINHPLGVALLLAESGVEDVATLQAAVLHDTVEDTDTSLEEIEREFGTLVRRIVDECTDDKALPKAERKRLQIVNAPHKSNQAKHVKLADKLYNLRDLQHATPNGWTPERVHEYFVWARKVTDGCRGVNASIEQQLDTIYAQVLGHVAS